MGCYCKDVTAKIDARKAERLQGRSAADWNAILTNGYRRFFDMPEHPVPEERTDYEQLVWTLDKLSPSGFGDRR